MTKKSGKYSSALSEIFSLGISDSFKNIAIVDKDYLFDVAFATSAAILKTILLSDQPNIKFAAMRLIKI